MYVSKIVRHEFVGSWVLVWVLVFTGIGIPIALIYLFYSTVRIESEMNNPEEFMSQYRAGKLRSKAESSVSAAT